MEDGLWKPGCGSALEVIVRGDAAEGGRSDHAALGASLLLQHLDAARGLPGKRAQAERGQKGQRGAGGSAARGRGQAGDCISHLQVGESAFDEVGEESANGRVVALPGGGYTYAGSEKGMDGRRRASKGVDGRRRASKGVDGARRSHLACSRW